MVDSQTATMIHADDASATIVSHTPQVTAWARRYFGPWWRAVDTPPPAPGSAADGPVIVAEVDPDSYTALADQVTSSRYEDAVYARSSVLVARDDDGGVSALSATDGLAYHATAGARRVLIAGTSERPVTLAAARLARETVRASLHRDGWTLLHASAVTRDGRAALSFGGKGAGKTTTALTLARSCGCALLANDRIFARGHRLGVQILPWPAAAAIGLGLLDALGWFDLARDRLLAGEHLHPTQDERVTAALVAGDRTPLHEPTGRELKAQVFPDQLTAWFGLPLATTGYATTLLFPTVVPGAAPALDDQQRGLTEADFFTDKTEDRYPDIFGLGHIDPTTRDHTRTIVREQLSHLPHRAITLSHYAAANIELLTSVVTE